MKITRLLREIKSALVNTEIIPFYFLGFCMLVIHLLVPVLTGDDVYFYYRPNSIVDLVFFRMRYFSWSSRILIEFILVALLKLPSIVWRVLNPIVITLIGYSISYIFGQTQRRKTNWLIVFLMFMYPFYQMSSVGWVTFSINYIWPLLFGLYSVVIFKKILLRKAIHLYEYFFSILLFVVAINQEILNIVFLLFFLSSFIYLKIRKENHWYINIILILCVISLVIILAAPGNYVRRSIEIKNFVDFDHLSLIQKIEIGLTSTFAHHIFNFNFLIFMLCLFLFTSVNYQYSDYFFKTYALIPLVVVLLFGNSIYLIVNRLFPHIAPLNSEMTKYGLITLQGFTQIYNYVSLVLLYTSIFFIIVSLFFIFKNTMKSVIAIGIFSLGIISRMVVAFSPTVWVSGVRTHFLLYFSIIICAVMVYQSILHEGNIRLSNNLLVVSGFIGSLSVINLIFAL